MSDWCKHMRNVLYLDLDMGDLIKRYNVNSMAFCPLCGEERPKPADEVELNKIFINYGCPVIAETNWEIYACGIDSFRAKILKWKRGE